MNKWPLEKIKQHIGQKDPGMILIISSCCCYRKYFSGSALFKLVGQRLAHLNLI
jgi:hypothetical protein